VRPAALWYAPTHSLFCFWRAFWLVTVTR
jgi:hypothetical protein